MKKIILSVAVATMALSTAAAALEDIKVNGQAKLWYETNNAGAVTATDKSELFNKVGSSGEVVFKLGVTGKQGNVGFGATVYQTSSMGLEGNLVNATRTQTTNLGNTAAAGPGTGINADADGEMYTGEMYITAPLGAKTLLKFGKQELDTPLAFTERWNAAPNTFNAAVAINNSIDNLTLIAAFVGQGSNNNYATSGEVTGLYMNTEVYAAGALYKNNGLAVNVWGYELASTAKAVWIDAATKIAGVNAKACYVNMNPAASNADSLNAFGLSASTKVGGIDVYGAASRVSDGNANSIAVGNTATGMKKTKLPTMGVYTDGLYVAQRGSQAFKVKASGKVAGTGLALQYINNSNSITAAQETSEIDLIISKKVGDVNLKAILMDRSFDADATDRTTGGQHVRVIASVDF